MGRRVVGSGGHNIYNATYTGVTLQYLVDLCGGLEDGVNQVHLTGWDEWENCALQQRLSNYYDHGLIALKINGEDIPYDLGGPMLLVAPGTGGAFWTKYVETIDFNEGDAPFDFVEDYADSIPGDELNYVSAAWFQNDGLDFKLGDPVELTGYAYALATSVAPLSAIEFSTDLGTTWQRIEVPEDFDPMQWVQFGLDGGRTLDHLPGGRRPCRAIGALEVLLHARKAGHVPAAKPQRQRPWYAKPHSAVVQFEVR